MRPNLGLRMQLGTVDKQMFLGCDPTLLNN